MMQETKNKNFKQIKQYFKLMTDHQKQVIYDKYNIIYDDVINVMS